MVAVNKIDKPDQSERVETQLSERGLVPEMGEHCNGPCFGTEQGIDELEMVCSWQRWES